MKKVRIDFICYGNICRSPMAEFIAADIIEKKGLKDKISVSSHGISHEEEDNPVYGPVLKILEEHGIPTYPHYSSKVKESMYDKYDMFVCMVEGHVKYLEILFNKHYDTKFSRLLDYTDEPDDIEDPWYTGKFEKVFEEVKVGVEALIDYVVKNVLD